MSAPWVVYWSRDHGEYWFHDPEFDVSTFKVPPRVFGEWRVIFSKADDEFFFWHRSSDEKTWEMPRASGRSRDEICAELRRLGAISVDAALTPSGFRHCYRKFWLKNHPDKGGEAPCEEVKELFQVVMDMDASASASSVASPRAAASLVTGAASGAGYNVLSLLDLPLAASVSEAEPQQCVAEGSEAREAGFVTEAKCFKRRWCRRYDDCVGDDVAATGALPTDGVWGGGVECAAQEIEVADVADGAPEEVIVGSVGARPDGQLLEGYDVVVEDCFDELAQIPRGPKRYHKNAPQAPCCVHSCDGGGFIYVGAFAAAQNADWVERNCVGLVVSVLGPRQRLPRVPQGVICFHFCSDRWSDDEQWCALVEAVRSTLGSGCSVLIHCMAGIHRAPVCAAGVLAILCQLSFQRAYRLVIESGRYVEPDMFQRYVGHEVVRALLLCAAGVRESYAGRVHLAEEESEATVHSPAIELPSADSAASNGLVRVDFQSELGAGSFGVVRRGIFLATGEGCAVKCIAAESEWVEEVRIHIRWAIRMYVLC